MSRAFLKPHPTAFIDSNPNSETVLDVYMLKVTDVDAYTKVVDAVDSVGTAVALGGWLLREPTPAGENFMAVVQCRLPPANK